MADPPLRSEPVGEDIKETPALALAMAIAMETLNPAMATAITFLLPHIPKPYSNSILHTCHHDGQHG